MKTDISHIPTSCLRFPIFSMLIPALTNAVLLAAARFVEFKLSFARCRNAADLRIVTL